MIDAFYIFTKGGLLLWSTQLVKVKGEPLDRLIKEVLIAERVGEPTANLDSYSLKWKILNEFDLFLVVVYQGILQIAYLEQLLSGVAKEFVSHIVDDFGNGMNLKQVNFDADFQKVMLKTSAQMKASRRSTPMKTFAETKKGTEVMKNMKEKGLTARTKKKPSQANNSSSDDEDDSGEPETGSGDKKQPPKATPTPAKTQKGKKKAARTWDDGKVTKGTMEALDFSKKVVRNSEGEAALDAKRAEFLGSEEEDVDETSSLSSDDEGEREEEKTGRVGGLFKSLTRGVKNLTGGAVLTEADLRPVLQNFKTALMTKNVAADVADKLASSVSATLVGRTTEKFTSMSATVKAALQESMEALLTPKKSIDVLRAAIAAKNAGRVYTIVFLGVNGVGKSTNLAKVAYYLKHKGNLNVLICACDTFRAGAVEQLKTHSRCLDVPLFERGYGKDPAEIAKAAIAHAGATGMDVVLVDTAGRMQDNEPLMRALAKLVALNKPDLVLFVGEALVGNDAIDQVTKFNRSLVEMSADRSNPRGIDGMLLTKYDTVDDKVGAALSMVYVTGQPIVFVGTGQKYTHLRQMQVQEVVRTLLK